MSINPYDPRWQRLAVLFCRSTRVRPRSNVLLHAIGPEALPFITALQDEVLRRGGFPDVQMTFPELERRFLRQATDDQLRAFPHWDLARMKAMDVYIAGRARANAFNLNGVPSERVMARTAVVRPIFDRRIKKTRWCITYVPTNGDALLAGMSTEDYTDFFFDACLQDYAAMGRAQEPLRALMERTDTVHITAQLLNAVRTYFERN
ncbi:aminopeptidase [Candidatus Falkowbacteria bacterium]|nr:aminopeptidase [Candidatus Falkowbacteria bacterium]